MTTLIKTKIKTKWTPYDDIIIENYNDMTAREIIEKFNIPFSSQSLTARAYYLKTYYNFKIEDHEYKYDIFNESLEAYYWLGFLFADGHFSENRRIELGLSYNDIEHLQKFKAFTKSNNNIKVETIINYGEEHRHCTFQINDALHIKNLCNKFKISNNKTINPPILRTNDMSDDQFLALAIGFMDGDGCVKTSQQGKEIARYTITLKIHENWLDNLQFIEKEIYRIVNIPLKELRSKIAGEGYAVLNLSKRQILEHLKDFMEQHNLPILERKWGKIKYGPKNGRYYKY